MYSVTQAVAATSKFTLLTAFVRCHYRVSVHSATAAIHAARACEAKRDRRLPVLIDAALDQTHDRPCSGGIHYSLRVTQRIVEVAD